MSPLIVNGKTENEIIKACLVNDRLAQRDIFHMYAGKMMVVCNRFTENRQLAEDILQDAFIKVFSNLQSFQFKGSFEGWLRRIVINTAIRMIQKEHQKFDDSLDDNYINEVAEPDIFASLSESDLINLIQELPVGYRMVFNLFAVEGYSHKEIGVLLGIEESTSRSQLTKARKMLQEKVYSLYNIAI